MRELEESLQRIANALEVLAAKCGALSPLASPLSVSSSSSEEFQKEKNFRKEECEKKTLLTMKRKAPELPDDLWIAGLAKDAAYAGLDVPMHVARCKNWCLENGRVFSRRRVLNWLNRQEKPMQIGGPPVSAPVIPPMPPANDPIARGLWHRSYGHLVKRAG